MRYAGMGWRGGEFVGAVLEENGTLLTTTAFPYRWEAVYAWLSEQQTLARGELTIAADSLSGVLEGPLVASSLPVRRLDPWQLPENGEYGSADPHTLATLACELGGEFDSIASHGWLFGRFHELKPSFYGSEAAELELSRTGKYLRRANGDRREVALTFDDGPDPRYTHRVLEVLARYGVGATFFCIGLHARAYPQILESIAEAGHTLANHTWSHPLMPDLCERDLTRQVVESAEAIGVVSGRPPALVRPPYGGRSPHVLQQIAELDMTTVTWDVDSNDWACPGEDEIVKRVLTKVAPGSVVLMHDSGGVREQTIAALPQIIESLLEDGYSLVTVPQLIDGLKGIA